MLRDPNTPRWGKWLTGLYLVGFLVLEAVRLWGQYH